jgi:hypothetical protein
MPNAKFYNLTFGILPYLAFCHIRHCVVWHSVVRHCKIRHSVVWHSDVRHSDVWHSDIAPKNYIMVRLANWSWSKATEQAWFCLSRAILCDLFHESPSKIHTFLNVLAGTVTNIWVARDRCYEFYNCWL